MASVYVLYIGENYISYSLELMRKICEPFSKSRPHVTVRGPITEERNDWDNNGISQLDLIGPSCFFSLDNAESPQNTVFIKCFSEEIYDIHYKPDYITSRPHITIYDGQSRDFAEKLLEKIRQFDWGIRVHLPGKYDKETLEYSYPILTEIKLKKRRGGKRKTEIIINEYLKEIFREIKQEELTVENLLNYSDNERLELISTIYKYLESRIINSSCRTNDNAHLILGEIIDINSLYKEEVLLELHNYQKSERKQLKLFEEFQLKTKNSKPQKIRNQLGQFPTPPELAVEIVKYIKSIFPNENIKIDFGDPSVGTGTFFYAFEKVFTSDRIGSACGVEIDQKIALLTNDLWAKHGLDVINGDFFDQKDLPPRNLILCNPPYIRHQYLSLQKKKQLKERVLKELDLHISGLASFYAYFMLLSHSWMKPGAVAGWLVPSEFLEVNYGESLRNYLTNNVTTILIHRYDPKKIKFQGVMVTSSVVIIKNERPPEQHQIKFSFGGSLISPEKIEYLENLSLKKEIKWNRNLILKNNSINTPRLKDYFQIVRGIATGANDFFILHKEQAEGLGISKTFLKPILPSPRKLKSQIIESDQYGYPVIEHPLSLIDCNLPEEYLKEKFPVMWDYLQTASELNLKNRYLIKRRNLWYKQEQREIPLFLCTYFGKEKENSAPLRFIWNKSNAIATNVYLLLYPTGRLLNVLKKMPNLQEDVFYCLSKISKKTMENGGRVYGGGMYKLEPNELKMLPVEGIEDIISNFPK